VQPPVLRLELGGALAETDQEVAASELAVETLDGLEICLAAAICDEQCADSVPDRKRPAQVRRVESCSCIEKATRPQPSRKHLRASEPLRLAPPQIPERVGERLHQPEVARRWAAVTRLGLRTKGTWT
jgi:hypothetical protein